MQIKDFLGLQMPHVPEHYLQKVAALAMALPTINVGDAAIGVVTLGILILWPRLGIRLPGHLPALLGGCAVMLVVNLLGGDVATIARSSIINWRTALRAMAFRSCCRSWYCPGYAGLKLYPELGLAAGSAACRLLNGDARRH